MLIASRREGRYPCTLLYGNVHRKMSQRVLATLSSIPRTNIKVEGEDQLHRALLWSVQGAHAHTHRSNDDSDNLDMPTTQLSTSLKAKYF